MLDFLRRRKEAKAMAAVGQAYVESVGDDMAADLNKWFEAVAAVDNEFLSGFNERMTQLESVDGMTSKEFAENELAAMMDNWNACRLTLRQREIEFLSGVRELAGAINASDEIEKTIRERWAAADLSYKAQVVLSFGEATEGSDS